MAHLKERSLLRQDLVRTYQFNVEQAADYLKRKPDFIPHSSRAANRLQSDESARQVMTLPFSLLWRALERLIGTIPRPLATLSKVSKDGLGCVARCVK